MELHGFRRQKSAASLKHFVSGGLDTLYLTVFRRQKSAASLKHPSPALIVAMSRTFPPAKVGGLIEATRAPSDR